MNQVAPFTDSFAVPLWETEPSLPDVGFSSLKGDPPLILKLALVIGCISVILIPTSHGTKLKGLCS